ncbi:hypothetical protein VTI28DRAFT_3958 [Corynascus sepedonium]
MQLRRDVDDLYAKRFVLCHNFLRKKKSSGDLDCSGGANIAADPDVAGVGVILSFLITAWFSFIITVFTFIFADGDLPECQETRLDKLI